MTIQESFTYFLEHQQELYAKYPGQYLIITGNFIADVKPTLDMAVLYATSHYLRPGTYLIQQCGPDERCYSIHTSAKIDYGIQGTI
ncbi:hypothetical protein [Prevotella pallens]|uniref:hypothetical protein n=1 Tax=Prevotella pallens TaxID=60133 RepID=UPI0028DB7EB7|nr:hypothetical protein [Prevotella pallens]